MIGLQSVDIVFSVQNMIDENNDYPANQSRIQIKVKGGKLGEIKMATPQGNTSLKK